MERNRSITDSSAETKHVRVVLDGPCCAGKSVLMYRLTSGKFRMQQPTMGGIFARHTFQCNDIDFEVGIFDLSGHGRYFPTNNLHYKSADILIEFFDISNPSGLDEIVTSRIPYFHSLSKPILLVGLKSDVRKETSGIRYPLFPYEFGPCLAHLVGAVKYMECSAKTNQGVLEVFEEAARVFYEKNYNYGIVNDNLKCLLLSKVSMDEEWKSIIQKVHPSQMCPIIDPVMRDQLERLDEQLCGGNDSDIIFSCDDFSACRNLDINTLRLVNNDLDIDTIRMKYSESSVILWPSNQLYTATGTDNKVVRRAKARISLQFAKKDCSSIDAFLGSCGSTHVKSLVIISCLGTLNVNFLLTLEGLQNLVIIDTKVELSNLSFSTRVISSLKCLILKECHTDIPEIPAILGMLSQLEILDVTCSSFKMLPESLGVLDNLRSLRCNHDHIVMRENYNPHVNSKNQY